MATGVLRLLGPLVLSRAVVVNSREHVAATSRHQRTETSIVVGSLRNHGRVKAKYVQVGLIVPWETQIRK